MDVIGGVLTHDDDGYSYLDEVPGSPFEAFDFVPVPEPNTVKNRIHWEVGLIEGATIDNLVAAGATVLDPACDANKSTMMADPQGNEFLPFATP